MLKRMDIPETGESGLQPRLPNAGWLGAAALTALVALIALAFVFAGRAEREDRRTELINNSLWVEQTLRFVLESGAGELARLTSDIRHGLQGRAIAEQLEVMQRLHPEILRLTYADFAKGVVISVPPSGGRTITDVSALPAVVSAFKLGEGQYGAPYDDQARGWRFDFALPAGSGSSSAVLVASYGISDLLAAHIPWWVARKVLVEVRDQNGQVVGTKSAIGAGPSGESHVIPFDPPGHGLTLAVTPYETLPHWITMVLPATIAILAVVVGASLLFLQRSVRQRQLAEERLRSESAFRRSMEDALTVGMRARDRDGRIIYANQAFCDMVGWSRDELVGRAPPMPYWDTDNLAETVARHDSILAGDVPKEGFEIRFRRRNGEPLDALIYEAPLNDAQGRHIGWMASIIDVTERKRMGELSKAQADELTRTARLVSVGEMASTLAHEINQPLTAISSYSKGLAARLEKGRVPVAEVKGILEKLAGQARRAGSIIHHLREFTKRSEPHLAATDLRQVAERTVGFLDADLARTGVAVTLDLGGEPCAVNGDEVLLEQVILNLVRNAAEAVQELPKERRAVKLSVGTDGELVRVSVRDFGPGVAAAMRDRLFVPFVSSKRDGMGMGLNICRSIVELHRGRVWQEDADPGCVFHVTIPLDEGEPA